MSVEELELGLSLGFRLTIVNPENPDLAEIQKHLKKLVADGLAKEEPFVHEGKTYPSYIRVPIIHPREPGVV